MSMIRLTSACNIVTGKLDSNAAIPDGKYPYFTCAPEPLRIDTYSFDTDAILLAGNNANGNFHCQRFNGKFNAYQRTYVITAKEGYDIDYIFYSLLINLQHLRRISQGSQTKFLTMSILDAFDLVNMEYEEQKRLVACLKSIDEKRKQNSSICADLEAMSKLLYDYWFVQFDFPDENGKPYKSSGGKMVWNEQLKREIPEGWKVSKLGRECDVLLGGTPDTNQVEYWDGGIPWLNSGEVANSPVLSSEKTITKKGMTNSATAFARAGAVVMSITRYIRPSILGMDACFNQSVVAIIPTDTMRTSYLYPLIRSNVPNYMQLRTGAQQPHINKEIVEETDFICPPKDILNKYYQQVDILYEMQMNAAKEINELQSMRDFLLPMLMNGQVKV